MIIIGKLWSFDTKIDDQFFFLKYKWLVTKVYHFLDCFIHFCYLCQTILLSVQTCSNDREGWHIIFKLQFLLDN